MLSDSLPLSRDGKRIVLICVLWLIGSIALFTRRTNYSFLLGLPLAVVFLAAVFFSFLYIAAEWRRRRWHSIIPLAAWLIALFASWALIPCLDRLLFAWSFSSYQTIVREIENGAIPVYPDVDNSILSPHHEALLAHRVFAERDANGILTVEFITESGFPAKHSGYLYVSSGVIESNSRKDSRWPIREKVRDKWFWVSN